MKNELNKKRSDIAELTDISSYDFANIFSVYQQDGYYLYNIIRNIQLPNVINTDIVRQVKVTGKMSWGNISQEIYGTIRLWWLVCIVNKIMNPVKLPKPGQVLTVIKPEYVASIITQINESI